MAGESSRFFKAGYTQPKYMLTLNDKSLFTHSVESFKKYFDTEKFIFIVRDDFDALKYVNKEITQLGIKDFDIITLEGTTRGQAETVALGVRNYKESRDSLIIFNIDSFRKNYIYPQNIDDYDGYLEVFKGQGDHWSFVRPINNHSTRIDLTTEKRRISNLCSTGLYYFKHVNDFLEAYDNYLETPKETWEKGELYVAPLYNYLINIKKNIHYHLIENEEVVFCGTPDEYESLCDVV